MVKRAEYYRNLSKSLLTLNIIKLNVKKAETEYMEIRKEAWECREIFITTLIEKAEGKNKTIIKEI